MANGIELAKAYVQVVPSTEGFADALKNQVGGAAESAGKSGGSAITKGFGGVLKTVGAASAAAIGAASAGMVAFGKSAVSAGQTFDASMSQVAATMGLTVDDIGELRDFAQEMGATTAFSASQAADALNYMALAGYSAETSMAMLPNVLNLAAAGGIDLAYASDMVTDTQSALGLSLDETTTMVDQMAKASSKSNTSVAQLGEAMLTIGATARNVAGGTQELSTVLGVLADNGIKGTEGGTHLRNVIMSLQNPTEDGALALEELGVQVYDSSGQMRSMIDIIADMQSGMSGMTDEAKSAMLSEIFNKTDIASVNALLGTTSERYTELSDAIGSASGAASTMADTQLDNLAGDVTLFQSALEGAQIAVSDALTPTLREFVQLGSEGLSDVAVAFKEGGIEGAAESLGGFLDKGIAMITQKLPSIISAGGKIVTSLLNGVVKVMPTLITAIVGILPQFIEGFLLITQGIIDALPQIITAIVDALPLLIPQIVTGLTMLLVALCENMAEIILPIIDALPMILTSIGQALIDNWPVLVGALISMIGELASGIGEMLAPVWEGVVSVATEWFTAIGEWLSGVWDSIVEIFSAVGTWVYDNIIAPVAEFFTGLWNGIVESFHTVIDPWIEIVKRISGIIKEKVIDPVLDFFKDLWESIKAVFRTVSSWFMEHIVNPIKTAFTNAWNALKNGATAAWTAVKNVFAPIVNWFKEKFQSAWQGVKNVFSTGGRIFSGIKEGIENVFKTVVNAIIRGINTVVAIPFNAINGFLNTLRGVSIVGVKPFSWISTFTVPQIPQLAKGGVLEDGGRLVVAGEAGGEAIVPLEKNTQWINRVADSMREALGEAGQTVMMGGVTFNINGENAREIAEQVMDLLQTQFERERRAFA